MTDHTTENVISIKPAKDRTAAKRQRQYRQRRKQGAVTPAMAPVTVPTVTPPQGQTVTVHRYGLHLLTVTAAVALAAVAAYFSVSGMVILFPGAVAAVVAMACAMECGKLVGAAWVAHHWQRTGGLLRAVLVALITALAVINAVGVYGRLSAAHLAPHAAAAAATEQEASTVGARIEWQTNVVGDLDRRIGQIDSAVEEATRRGRGRAAMALADEQRRNREALAAQRQHEAATLVSLKDDQAQVQAESRKVEADIGPLRYAATLIGLGDEQAIRWLILLMVLTCDPMAIVLVIAASARTKSA